MAKAGFWLNGARGKLKGSIIKAAPGGGTQIAAIGTPSNPQTEAQTEQRAKFKLVSQLGAVMKPVIAIKRDGAKSGRNQFASINSSSARFSQGMADINLNRVQLTKSNTPIAGFNADRSGQATVVELNEDYSARLEKVVYIQFEKTTAGELALLDSVVVSTAGEGGTFPGSLTKSDKAVVIYAYGVNINDAKTREKFGNITAPTAQDVAQLAVRTSAYDNALEMTKTVGLTMAVGEDSADSDDVEHITVSVIVSGNGSATGGGRFIAGQMVTLTATPDAEASFVAWKANNASGAVLSTNPTYSFEADANVTVCAVFEGGPVPHYDITLSADPANGGTVNGGGSKEEGSSCTVVAIPAEGMMFDGWFENGSLVSNDASYTFTVERARTLVAQFAEQPEGMILSIKYNGQDISNANVLGANPYVGAFESAANGKTFAIVKAQQAPTVGSTVTIQANESASISSGAATLQTSDTYGSPARAYFCVGNLSGTSFSILEVFPVSVGLEDDN